MQIIVFILLFLTYVQAILPALMRCTMASDLPKRLCIIIDNIGGLMTGKRNAHDSNYYKIFSGITE